MKAKVFVTLKQGVLDPQGKAIHTVVELLGFEPIRDIRQGKFFEIYLDGTLSVSEAEEMVKKIANEVLANPVIEEYKVEIETL
jgi:phosphoribosylformylglycinamidine synthase